MASDLKAAKPITFKEARTIIVGRASAIMDQKRALRGTENIERQGLSGVITRIAEDKLSRIQRHVQEQLFWQMVEDRPWAKTSLASAGWSRDACAPKDLDGDTFEDDLLDVLNYSIIALALHHGWWSLKD